MVTSREVARLAGVSQPTVSRALRDSAKVSSETKDRVRAAAELLGYVPSATGRALSVGRSRRIGLLLTDLENQFYQYVIAPMHDELDELGYQLVLITESSDASPVADRIASGGFDGVLLATTTVDSLLPVRLRDRQIPFVYMNRTSAVVDADSVTVDPRAGVESLVTELAVLGHRDVAAIFGPANTSTAEARETSIRRHLAEVDIKVTDRYTLHGQFDFATGFSGARQLLETDPPPQVILCANDVVALGALNAAAELGIAVPGQVSIVGFDDLPTARWPLVQLTTVGYDLDGMARRAAGLLVERIEGTAPAAYQHVLFSTHLELRRTLGPARS